MIKNINIENFKSLKHINLEFKNLNLLTGMNSAGKSSLIQSILLLKQNIETNKELIIGVRDFYKANNAYDEYFNKLISQLINRLSLDGRYINLSASGNLLYENAITDEIVFKLKLNNIELVFKCDLSNNPIDSSLNCITELNGDINGLYNENKFGYLSANRITPKSVYEYSNDNILNDNIGTSGEYTAHYLAEYKNSELKIEHLRHPSAYSNHLLENVSLWLSEISEGIDVSAEANNELRNSNIKYSYGGKKLSPQNVGFGITYALPIIVLILKSKPGDLLIIENPESHLHPSGQVKIATLCSKAAAAGVQIIIETHSDHFVNGTRVSAKEKIIDSANVNIYYFTKDINIVNNCTTVQNLNLQENGKIDTWPKGFFDEWDIQLEKLLW